MFFGREKDVAELMGLWNKRVSSFVTCRGRRRIGKSTLIEKFAEESGATFIELVGLKPAKAFSNATELSAFAEQLARQTGCDDTPPSSWMRAFTRLDREIRDTGRTVVLLDEISWMAHYDAAFAETLKIAWDTLFKKHDGLVFVVCGSVSTWIRDNLIDSGSFFGRRSLDVVVDELPLRECVKFWGDRASRIDAREIIDILSVTGGVPRYLEEIDPSLGANENIRRLAFSPHGILREDFDEMFDDVITKLPALSGRLLRCLTGEAKSVSELVEMLGISRGGTVSDVLHCLIEAGLVKRDAGRNPETGDAVKEARYRLKDNYARFYLKYIEPVKDVIDEGAYDLASLADMPGWDAVLGLAFENLVVNNYREVIPHLHLDGAQIISAAPYCRRKSGTHPGCQVDLLLQCRRALHFIEIKRQNEIGRDVIDQVDEQVRRVSRPAGVSARTALVYEGHLSRVAQTDGYFDAIVPFQKLLGL